MVTLDVPFAGAFADVSYVGEPDSQRRYEVFPVYLASAFKVAAECSLGLWTRPKNRLSVEVDSGKRGSHFFNSKASTWQSFVQVTSKPAAASTSLAKR